MNIMHRLVPGLLAGSLVIGGASSAFAAKGKARVAHAVAYGQVSNLSATGFTLTRTPKKAGAAAPTIVQVAVSSATKEKARKGTTGALANGEYAFVVGAKGTSGISAKRVLYSSAEFNAHRLVLRIKAQQLAKRALRGKRVAGTVNAASTTPTSLAITTAKGKTLTFAITAQTKYRINKALTTTAPTLTNGEKVRVLFARNAASKSRTARVIVVVSTAAA